MSQTAPNAARSSPGQGPAGPSIAKLSRQTIPAVAILIGVAIWSAKKTLPNSSFTVQQVPADKLTAPGALEGALAPNNRLFSSSVEKIFERVHGSESTSFGPDGAQYGSDDSGHVWRVAPGASKPARFAFMGGRPMGHRVDAAGNLIMADACKGLVSLNLETGEKRLLANHVDDVTSFHNRSEITYANDLDIASDGTIYFSASTDIAPSKAADGKCDTFGAFFQMYFHGASTGRLLSYNPRTGQTEALADGIFCANGLALSKDETYLLVVETLALRILKVWLKGSKAGQTEIFATNMPGMPDGISRGSDGTFWVAIAARPPAALYMLRAYPTIRWVSAWVPSSWMPQPKPYGLVLQISEEGEILQSLHDPSGTHAFAISSVHEHQGSLYLGSLSAPYMLRVKL